jgi:regulator of sigma E protease
MKWSVEMSVQTILLTALMFFVLVSVHEWGHFYFAKRAGVFVHEFAIGFGPKVFSFLWGETRYTLRLFPFGGYVKMAGENGLEEEGVAPERMFQQKTILQRALSIFAGPMMNFVLAFVLFFSFAYMIGMPNGTPTKIKIYEVVANSPAANAGLKANDVVQSINGSSIAANVNKLIGFISDNPNKPLTWVVLRAGQPKTLVITPKKTEGHTTVGIRLSVVQPKRAPSVFEASKSASKLLVEGTKQIFIGFKMLVTLQFKLDDLGGPIRITEYTSQAIQSGFSTYIFWSAILSLYLGLFNLLPFPALDGSRLLFLALEAVRGKPLESGRENIVHFIGFAIMMVLMVTVTFNDIVRLIKG